jgi:endonuclease YncB( thermonuclease family)
MPLSIIKGEFRILGSEPDGDSVHFHPTNPDAFTSLHLPARVSGQGATQLRLEAIDALETHYSPRVPGGFLQHQPLGLAHAAAAELLRLLGFTDVQRDGEQVTSSVPEQTEGYILTRFADKYGRAVSFAYAGVSDHEDLDSVFVDAELLGQSVNYQLVTSGLVYPTYYSKLFPDLREALTAAASQARADQQGVWAQDTTTSGATIASLEALNDQLVLLPKLFRRLIDYLALGAGSIALDGFLAFLASRDDRLFVISEAHPTGLDNITRVDGQTVRLLHPPDDLIFLEA